jgi:hypothetical protein
MENKMNIKMLKAAVAGLILSIGGFANATLIDNDSYTTDSESGLDWLDWTAASGVTQTDALATFESGGWRVANENDVFELLNNFFDTTFSSDSSNLISTGSLPDFTARFAQFKELFGSNNGSQVFGRIEGFGLIGAQNSYVFSGYIPSNYGSINNTSTRQGVALVRDTMQVPEPSTLAIFALGIIGLASRRFKKKA